MVTATVVVIHLALVPWNAPEVSKVDAIRVVKNWSRRSLHVFVKNARDVIMKDSEMRRFLCLTWNGWLNVFLQFTGFRLVRHVEMDGLVPPIGTITKWEFRFVGLPWRYGWSLPRFK